jgi:hypothetical protein
MIHTLIDHDEIKMAYLMHFDIPSECMTIEIQNTPEAKASTVWVMMTDQWNDPLFSPSTVLMGHLHSDFILPIVIDHDAVTDMAVATSEMVKEKWAGFIQRCRGKSRNESAVGREMVNTTLIRFLLTKCVPFVFINFCLHRFCHLL